ncbi:survival of motor neuron-related-splicing factor 30 [Lethenteron reissneri]|uniref:survival of motor neuron-related-splicing factor 30 n=1 Tax=Lethenteron reissneri TaxID=7753 RepID=UPI002AB6DC12|nr:survival of motor neuron-related-splicing factor 30 [Lethenteron reissneri]XP_061408757.1 survival of motor neuron-related-splicing factor 30 [Lethenteron reissneri]
MAEDLPTQLSNYKVQLQQVEAALTADPNNQDLLKLKKDLQEVIDLTQDLLTTQTSESSASAAEREPGRSQAPSWAVGDHCLATWNEDGQWYEAEIEEVNVDGGTVAVTFAGYGNTEVVPMHSLKPVEQERQLSHELDTGNKPKSKKELLAQQREYKKKKALKKAQRMKDMETERESQKSKWQDFNNKAYCKTKKGHVKKSIFASPESVNGRVGVGTCGIADKPMTQFQDAAKYNVRHYMPQ